MVATVGEALAGKTILITGGSGTIGCELVRRLIPFRPRRIRVLGRDEGRLWALQQELRDHDCVRYLLGDVRDAERMRRAAEGCDVIYHLAGLKHVPLCEHNPFEAVATNVVGTQNVILAALEHDVERVIFTSSDKAASPSNVMGTSKLLAEKLVTAAHYQRGSRRTVFASVRFGNVVGSRASALPLFVRQIEAGGPVTLTHPDMIRFVLSVDRAVELIFECTALAIGGEVFAMKMPAVRVGDLVSVLIRELAADPAAVEIETIGIRPGEKLYEDLVTEEESERSIELPHLYVILPPGQPQESFRYPYGPLAPVPRGRYASDTAERLAADEIARSLDTWMLLQPDFSP